MLRYKVRSLHNNKRPPYVIVTKLLGQRVTMDEYDSYVGAMIEALAIDKRESEK